ncbi:MAG: OsmC family protein [Limnochordales bacterium]
MSSPTTEVIVRHEGGLAFAAKGPSGHEIRMDAAPDVGGGDSAARPMEMLLAALGGCSGIDVAIILNKMRVDYEGFEMRIHGRRAEEHPKIYTSIDVEYVFRGKDLAAQRDKLEKAARLSFEKYCSVAGMLNKAAEMTYRVTIEE